MQDEEVAAGDRDTWHFGEMERRLGVAALAV